MGSIIEREEQENFENLLLSGNGLSTSTSIASACNLEVLVDSDDAFDSVFISPQEETFQAVHPVCAFQNSVHLARQSSPIAVSRPQQNEDLNADHKIINSDEHTAYDSRDNSLTLSGSIIRDSFDVLSEESPVFSDNSDIFYTPETSDGFIAVNDLSAPKKDLPALPMNETFEKSQPEKKYTTELPGQKESEKEAHGSCARNDESEQGIEDQESILEYYVSDFFPDLALARQAREIADQQTQPNFDNPVHQVFEPESLHEREQRKRDREDEHAQNNSPDGPRGKEHLNPDVCHDALEATVIAEFELSGVVHSPDPSTESEPIQVCVIETDLLVTSIDQVTLVEERLAESVLPDRLTCLPALEEKPHEDVDITEKAREDGKSSPPPLPPVTDTVEIAEKPISNEDLSKSPIQAPVLATSLEEMNGLHQDMQVNLSVLPAVSDDTTAETNHPIVEVLCASESPPIHTGNDPEKTTVPQHTADRPNWALAPLDPPQTKSILGNKPAKSERQKASERRGKQKKGETVLPVDVNSKLDSISLVRRLSMSSGVSTSVDRAKRVSQGSPIGKSKDAEVPFSSLRAIYSEKRLGEPMAKGQVPKGMTQNGCDAMVKSIQVGTRGIGSQTNNVDQSLQPQATLQRHRSRSMSVLIQGGSSHDKRQANPLPTWRAGTNLPAGSEYRSNARNEGIAKKHSPVQTTSSNFSGPPGVREKREVAGNVADSRRIKPTRIQPSLTVSSRKDSKETASEVDSSLTFTPRHGTSYKQEKGQGSVSPLSDEFQANERPPLPWRSGIGRSLSTHISPIAPQTQAAHVKERKPRALPMELETRLTTSPQTKTLSVGYEDSSLHTREIGEPVKVNLPQSSTPTKPHFHFRSSNAPPVIHPNNSVPPMTRSLANGPSYMLENDVATQRLVASIQAQLARPETTNNSSFQNQRGHSLEALEHADRVVPRFHPSSVSHSSAPQQEMGPGVSFNGPGRFATRMAAPTHRHNMSVQLPDTNLRFREAIPALPINQIGFPFHGTNRLGNRELPQTAMVQQQVSGQDGMHGRNPQVLHGNGAFSGHYRVDHPFLENPDGWRGQFGLGNSSQVAAVPRQAYHPTINNQSGGLQPFHPYPRTQRSPVYRTERSNGTN